MTLIICFLQEEAFPNTIEEVKKGKMDTIQIIYNCRKIIHKRNDNTYDWMLKPPRNHEVPPFKYMKECAEAT